ncbi:right-handed parallel beta-helix repeat-containing protein [bacterium]|nr:right-handed parallel beta-helix repeat-containing protein [bacterium]
MSVSSRVVHCLVAFLILGTAAFASDGAMVNYQGRVLSQGFPYSGMGQMKVAIVATTGTSTLYSLWSNDGSSVAGSEPAGSFGVTVTGGVFDVMLGDTDLMNKIPAVIFNRNGELKVRVWFNDGTHGFQQLTPDRRITNPRRLGLTRVTEPLDVYVNSSDGDDMNDGLTTDTAKRTVQAALDMLPRSIYAPTTVRLAPGAYAPFHVSGFQDMMAGLAILGDPTHDPTLDQSLNVTITAPNKDGVGIDVAGSRSVTITGFSTTNFYDGIQVSGASTWITIRRCKVADFYWGGIDFNNQSSGTIEYCLATGGGRGFQIQDRSGAILAGSIAEKNGTGLFCYWCSNVTFSAAVLRNNSQFGILSRYNCAMAASSNVTLTGNGQDVNCASGSGLY